MWRTQLNKAVREVRFVLKQAPEHHGVWRFTETRLGELRMLNQNTFFSVSEISEEFKTPSACHFIYGDAHATEDHVLTEGLTNEAFEELLKEKVAFGLTLERFDREPSLPSDIVESHKYVKHSDDIF